MSTTASTDIELLNAAGTTWLTLPLVDEVNNKDEHQYRSTPAQLAALLNGTPLGQRLYPVNWVNRGLGIGLDYNTAYGLYTRTPGIVISAGAWNSVGVQSVATGKIVAIEEFLADLFVASEVSATNGRVSRNAGGSATGVNAFANVTMTDYAAAANINDGTMRDLCLFDDGAGTRYLYASSSDSNGLNGRLHRTSDGINWSSTPAARFGTNGRNRMWRVFWRTRDGLGGPRLFTISGKNKISYTIPNADPFLAASWIEGLVIDTASTLLELGGSRKHVYMTARDNTFDVDENGDSVGLMSYSRQMPQDGNGASIQYMSGYLYVSMGRGMHRIYVGDATATLQEQVAQCAPGWGTRAENDVRGYITAMCPDQGEIVASVYNPTTKKSFICWGIPKTEWHQQISDTGPNPMLWYGPEVLCDADYKVSRLRTSGLAGDLRLWIAAQSVAGNGLVIGYITLPIAGAPLQDLISGGGMRFATGVPGSGTDAFFQPRCSLDLLKEVWDDQVVTKIVEQDAFATRGLSVVTQANGSTVNDNLGTKLTLQEISDPAPGAITWPTARDVTISPSQTLTPADPAAPVKGSAIWRRINFFNPSGAASTPKIGVLEACRIDAWRVAPSALARTLTVQYGDGVMDRYGGTRQSQDPDWLTQQLQDLTAAGRTTLRLSNDLKYTFKLDQVLDIEEIEVPGGAFGKQVTAKISGVILGSVA